MQAPRCKHVCAAGSVQAAPPRLPAQGRHRLRASTQCQAYKWPVWDKMWQKLIEYDLQSVSPQDAQGMLDSGDWVAIDVRPKKDFDKASPEGAQSAPLFQSFSMQQSANPKGLLRAAAYAFNGVSPVEPNPNWAQDFKQAAGGKKVLVMCETGGTTKPSANFMTGKTSRSLKAAWRALDEKLCPEVAHLDGGIFAWSKAGRPMRGEYDGSNAGRTPGRAEEPTVADPEPQDVPMR